MKKIRHTIVRGVENTLKFIKQCHCGSRIVKCNLIVAIGQLLSCFYRLFLLLLHADDVIVVRKSDKIVGKKKSEKELEVLYREGLVGVRDIVGFMKIHFKKDVWVCISQGNRHTKCRVSGLFDILNKMCCKRDKCCTIVVKDPFCSFRFIINVSNRNRTKYIEISNIIKETKRNANAFTDKKKSLTKSTQSPKQSFYYSKNMNVIDKITKHDKNDSKGSLESLAAFIMYHGNYLSKKNVSWYTQEDSDEYKVMVVTDIVSSTALWCEDDQEMSLAITKHDYIALNLIEKYGGLPSRNEGDSFFVFFDSVEAATRFSLSFNKQIRKIKVLNRQLEIKIAIHAGVVKMSAGRNLDACGKPVKEISAMLSHTASNRICISKSLLNKYSSSNIFCVH